jgi:hypothetical protein
MRNAKTSCEPGGREVNADREGSKEGFKLWVCCSGCGGSGWEHIESGELG